MTATDTINVYSFNRYDDFLRMVGQRFLARRNRPFSLDEWAKELGYRSHSSLTMVLRGERLPSKRMRSILAFKLALGPNDQRYLDLLVHLECQRRKGRPVREILAQLEEMNPQFARRAPLAADTLSYIAEWYHIVIKQLIDRSDFREDPAWICDRLRGKVSTAEVKAAIDTMLRLAIIIRDPETGRLYIEKQSLQSSQEIPSSALKLHHKQMLTRAIEAIAEQDVEGREITSLTLRFSPSRLREAKAMIRRFKDEFDQAFEDLQSNAVYQLNIQYFTHTDQ